MPTQQVPGADCITDLLNRLRPHSRRGEHSPHKYILLLAVATIAASDKEHGNRFTFEELEPQFAAEFEKCLPHWPAERRQLEYPFYYLQFDGCWRLQVRTGAEAAYHRYQDTRLTRNRLLETIAYAEIDGNILAALRREHGRALVEARLAALGASATADDQDGSAQVREGTAEYNVLPDPSSLFEHEQRALRSLRAAMPPPAHLVSNLEIHDSQSNGYYECDAVIVARSGLYVTELKHWSGHVRVAPNHWLIDGYRYRRDPHVGNGFKCRLLRGLYERQFPTYPGLWVESVVVLTNPDATVENADSPMAAATGKRHNLTFASIDDFLSYLRRREAAVTGPGLSPAQTGAVTTFLQSLARPPRRQVYTMPGYETVEYLAQRPECIELLARPVDGRSRGLTRFRIFRLPEAGTPEDKARAKLKALNTVDAVGRIGDHPNIHRVWVQRTDEGDIAEGSEWSEAGTLRDRMRDREHPFSADEALAVCRGIALALAAAHEAGIIHRAVKPEHVLMMNGLPKLTDFDLSFYLDKSGDITVLPDPTRLRDDGYTAPELLAGKDIDESTDLFSLGVIAYELLTRDKPFAAARHWAAQGGKLSDQQLERLAAKGLPERSIAAIRGAVVGDRAGRIKDAAQMAAAFAARGATELPAVAPNARLNPGDRYDVYEIIALLGEGAEAQTYLARTLLEKKVALKLFNREVPRQAIFRQQAVASAIASPYVVRSDGRMGLWQGDRFFLVLEYVEGETLRARMQRCGRPDRESFARVARGLMDALQAFHGHHGQAGPEPLVHGDVKPENILLAGSGEPKLADLSVAGPPRIDEFAGTVGYVPPDRILDDQMQFAADGDLFALGVTLWEWLFGAKPYGNPAVGDTPATPELPSPEMPDGWVPWLRRAVATGEAERYASIEAMSQAFEEASAPAPVTPPATSPPAGPPETGPTPEAGAGTSAAQLQLITLPGEPGNPFVAYLNSLCNASAGNENAMAEAQSSNALFERLYVRSPLAEVVLRELIDSRHSVILTGNAGDGKTTIAAEVHRKLTGRWMPATPRLEVPGERLVIVKDMSELTAAERGRVLEQAVRSEDCAYLIVTNSGTLLEGARQARLSAVDPYGVESDLLRALEADDVVPVLGGRLRLLNVGRTDSIETACAVFRRMLERENWLACQGCGLAGRCPLLSNVQLVRAHEDVAVARVELAYRRLYEYGVRLTMRQMTGHLAYALTAGRDCAALRGLSQTALAQGRIGSLLFNRFFGDDGERLAAESLQLRPVHQLRSAELGVALDPAFEREAWAGDGPGAGLSGQALEVLRELRRQGASSSPAARRQARRLAYFFGALDDAAGREYLSVFLRSPSLLPYLEIVRGPGKVPPLWEADWRRRVVQVLQEYFAAVRLPEGSWQATDRLYITLNPRSGSSNTLVVLASVATDELAICLQRGHRAVKGSSGRLLLCERKGEATLALELPFLDYVARRCRGEIAAQLSAFYGDRLERFGAELLAARGRDAEDAGSLQLLRVGADRRLRPLQLRFAGEQLEVVR